MTALLTATEAKALRLIARADGAYVTTERRRGGYRVHSRLNVAARTLRTLRRLGLTEGGPGDLEDAQERATDTGLALAPAADLTAGGWETLHKLRDADEPLMTTTRPGPRSVNAAAVKSLRARGLVRLRLRAYSHSSDVELTDVGRAALDAYAAARAAEARHRREWGRGVRG